MTNDETPSGPQRVEKTGLALVHEGEWIFAQQGLGRAAHRTAARPWSIIIFPS